MVMTSRCPGCQVVADAQAEIPNGPEGRGVKIALVPPAVKAALRLAHEAQRAARTTH